MDRLPNLQKLNLEARETALGLWRTPRREEMVFGKGVVMKLELNSILSISRAYTGETVVTNPYLQV